jgi:antibiotic biosynthesis monooxygenase (ABM) superfamily enzyme
MNRSMSTQDSIRPDTPTPGRPVAPPSQHHRALYTWLSVYSAITAVQLLLGASIAHLPLAIRTLILTAIVVPFVVYLLVPALLRLHTRFTGRTR